MSVEILKYVTEAHQDVYMRYTVTITEYYVDKYGFCFNLFEDKLNVFKSEPRFSDKDKYKDKKETISIDSSIIEGLYEILLQEEHINKLKETEKHLLKKALPILTKNLSDSSSSDDDSSEKIQHKKIEKKVLQEYIQKNNLSPKTWIGIENGEIIGHGDLKSFKKFKIHKNGRTLYQVRELLDVE